MKKTLTLALALILVLSVAPLACAKTVLQIGHPNPGTDTDHCHAFCRFFKEELESRSDEFEVQIFSDSQLGGLRDCIEGMSMGTVDMAINMNSDFGAFIDDSTVLDLPFLFGSREEVYSVIYDEEITGPIFKKLEEDFGVHVLTYGDGGFRYLLNNVRPVNTLEDFGGIKLRLSESPIFVKTFQALGCNPSTLPFSECFTALQQGTVDGLELPVLSTYTGHYDEIIDYMTLTGHFFTPLSISISTSRWDTFTPEQQAMIEEAADVAAERETAFIIEMEEKDLAEMQAKGLKINSVSEEELARFREAVQPVYDEFVPMIDAELYNKVMTKLGKN